ncbi:DUF2806 domain-containing protein [Klebsiella pneumoniae]|uniref:DUF2806 domain-containing protein n=1 Tax=Klebsiella pneumoniae TaxID=573 RepID=UPI000282F703|nr:DUF2806 domain-containing protein [Klebsiella pneumoniae]EKB82112.1 hypothetical protein HMPREF1308_05344 [Klebsiella pneumoniae subsp. pneumoniae WGLW5]EKK4991962.1 DUF2806 domain-containing protein [Klebsiella pneumoniae]EKR4055429.1 DUF2806 domain-containing protein [Klebsiella pneumoniae]EKU9049267.1 DUF2806 domain-containing protein [Klebsiella pneumoniae]EKW4935508.1 DUF2806 domain-containing protein [Klebsiella pneumoniae]
MADSEISGVLAIVQKVAKPLYSIVKITGPFIMAQSKTAVENYSDFKLNKSRLEAISTLLQEEVKNISSDRAMLREKIINSSGIERVRAQEDYNLLTKEINKLSTIDKIKNFIGDDDIIDNDKGIADSWINKFNELASSLNEEWRKQLLAKAFALELKKSGTINILTLNSIASFDENTFKLFGFLVNSSIRMYEVNCLPSVDKNVEFSIDGKIKKLSTIEYELGHLNLIDLSNNNFINIENREIYLRYGRRVLKIKYTREQVPEAHRILANVFTPLGNSIANLYTRHLNDFGNDNFERFLRIATKNGYICQEIEMSQQLYSELGN